MEGVAEGKSQNPFKSAQSVSSVFLLMSLYAEGVKAQRKTS